MTEQNTPRLIPYEGIPVEDGTYNLGQLSKSGYGRVVIPGYETDAILYEDMPVSMPEHVFAALFEYVKGRDCPIQNFKAVVKNHEIIHVYD